MAKKSNKIGIYGGTFNPIHYGHLRTAEEVFEMLSLDRVLFIPSGVTPFDKPDPVKPEHRYKMVKAAIKGNPRFRISNIELKTGGKSFTVDTIMKLKEKYKERELFFILGIDAFLDLPSWKQPDRLMRHSNMVVLSRPGYSFCDLALSPYLEGVSKRTLKELDKGTRTEFTFKTSTKQKCHLCNVTGLNISASGIRKSIMSGGNINYLLPESVKSYIISNKLYENIM